MTEIEPESTPDSETNVAFALTRQARANPDGLALIMPGRQTRDGWEDRRYTYGELEDLTNRLAAGMQARGFEPGTRVAMMVPPSLEFLTVFFALFKAGCIPVLIDPGIGLKPLKACLGQARPEAFVGITRAHLARVVLGWARDSVANLVTVGPRLGWGGCGLDELLDAGGKGRFSIPEADEEATAAILFTSGSTGIPKGVVYRHRHFAAQVALVRDTYDMQAGEVDLPTFPPFALFDPAIGMTTVFPVMDFTRPARVDPKMLVSLIEHYGVTNLFGSPALMETLSRHLEARGIRLPGLRRVLSAGAPVPPRVIDRMHKALNSGADIHTPYGATECLPVATIGGRELVGEASQGNRDGLGICVGRPLEANRVRIIEVDDGPFEHLDETRSLATGEVGEIVVHGPTATDTYWERKEQTRLAKLIDGQGRVWHRMGDLGWLDDRGRLWYCGRKSERVMTSDQNLYTEQVEGVFNALEGVFRSALVGIGPEDRREAVLVVEPEKNADRAELRERILQTAAEYTHTGSIRQVLFHRRFPVDIRHNAKIRRRELADWAEKKLGPVDSGDGEDRESDGKSGKKRSPTREKGTPEKKKTSRKNSGKKGSG